MDGDSFINQLMHSLAHGYTEDQQLLISDASVACPSSDPPHSESFINQLMYALAHGYAEDQEAPIDISDAPVACSDSYSCRTGQKRKRWDPYEGSQPEFRRGIEDFTGCSDPSEQLARFQSYVNYLTPPAVEKDPVPYRKASESTKRRARRAMDPFVEKIKEVTGYYSLDDLSLLFEDYIEKDICNRRSSSQQEESSISRGVLEAGMKLKMMSERDQEMFLFLMEVDGDNIAEVLLHFCPGDSNKNFRSRLKMRYLNGGRKKRTDSRDAALVHDYMHTHMRVDTFGQARMVGFDENGDCVKHRPHTLNGTLDEIYKDQFLSSDEYLAHLECNPSMKIGLSLFKSHARCPCMVQPKFRFCADEIQVGILEILKAIRERRKRPVPETLRFQPCECSYCSDFTCRKNVDKSLLCPETNEHTFLQHVVVCPKVIFPESDTFVYQQKCMFGTCAECNAFRESSLCFFSCPRRFGNETVYKYLKYSVAEFDTNKAKELVPIHANGFELRNELKASLKKYLKHHWEYKWLHLCHQADINACDEHTLVIQTDFSAVVELIAQEKLNSAISGYSQMSCWAVMHSPEILEKNEARKKYLKCDHIRIITPGTKEKTKDGDWFCHSVMLTYLINYYERTLRKQIRRIILWTDGSPSQYKCRQGFAFEADVLNKFFPNIQVYYFFNVQLLFLK
jgi:hypothetical protein